MELKDGQTIFSNDPAASYLKKTFENTNVFPVSKQLTIHL